MEFDHWLKEYGSTEDSMIVGDIEEHQITGKNNF